MAMTAIYTNNVILITNQNVLTLALIRIMTETEPTTPQNQAASAVQVQNIGNTDGSNTSAQKMSLLRSLQFVCFDFLQRCQPYGPWRIPTKTR